jgi:hypothetical protein
MKKTVCDVDHFLAQESCPVNMKKAVHFLAHLFDNRQPLTRNDDMFGPTPNSLSSQANEVAADRMANVRMHARTPP